MAKRTPLEIFIAAAEASYRKAYMAFHRPALAAGASLTPLCPNGECFEINASSGHKAVEVFGALKIEQLPRRRRDSNEQKSQDRVNVLLSSKDIYFYGKKPTVETRYLAESYVNVSYYRVRQGKWQTRLSLRYDFASRGAGSAHPIFHAQVSDGIPGGKLAMLSGVPKKTDIIGLPDPYQDIRLPTANMIGATALLKLAADHLSHEEFIPVLRNFQVLPFFKNWQYKCDTLDPEDSAEELLSIGWYGIKP